jgi:Ice-binding-like
VAVQALMNARAAFEVTEALTCPAANNLSGQNLGGTSLAPGVYCFDADARLTGTLTLTGAGPWTFQVGGLLTIDPGAQVLAPAVTSVCKGSSVRWQVDGTTATLGAGATVIGNILAANDISLAAGASLDGRAIALQGDATLSANQVAACSNGGRFPPHTAIKVTGGGQLSVPEPDSDDHRRRGRGRSTFAFAAIPGVNGADATGRFVYLNHANRSHSSTFGRMKVFGRVRDIDVVAVGEDGSPKTVRFDGTCAQRPDCTFSVLVEDNGEGHRHDDDDDHDGDDDDNEGDGLPGASHDRRVRPRDRLAVVIVANGRVVEARGLRPIARGNIQFHRPLAAGLTTDINDVEFGPGNMLDVSVSLSAVPVPTLADAYVVLELPNGQLMSWTGSGLVPGLVPIARGFMPFPFQGSLAQIVVPRGTPPGRYTWLSALTATGTLNLLTPIAESVFTITP